MNILELFCGTKSVGKVAATCGYDTIISLDVDKRCEPTICSSILDFDYKQYPVGFFHFIWASPPCTEFSKAKTTGVRKIAEATEIVEKVLEIIDHLKPAFYCIENPVGLLRWQPCMHPHQGNRNTVSYCRYGFGYQKNTDLWTNVSFEPRRCVKGSYCDQKRRFGCHLTHCQRGAYSLGDTKNCHIKHVSSLRQRYCIPPLLLADILEKTAALNSRKRKTTDKEPKTIIVVRIVRRKRS